MTLANTPIQNPPNVPNEAGVPPLSAYNAPPPPPPLQGDSPNVVSQLANKPQWGVFLNGSPAINPDSVKGVEPSKEYRLLDYPVETGAFQSYNKVEMPYEAHVELMKGGKEADRVEFLQTIERIAFDLNLYSIVTPEVTYVNANLTRFDYERTASKGATLLTVRLFFKQVRTTATPTFSKTVAPTSASAVNDGTVQPKAVPPALVPVMKWH